MHFDEIQNRVEAMLPPGAAADPIMAGDGILKFIKATTLIR